MSGVKGFIHEIHRRSLWQVLALYLAGSWVVLQVVNEVAESARLPDWVSSAAFVLLLIGFPIVLATAFVQEGVGGREAKAAAGDSVVSASDRGVADSVGPRPTDAAPAAVHHRLFTWRNAIAGGVVAFALWGVVAAGWLVLGGSGGETAVSVVAAESGERSDLPSIAVLPFTSVRTDEESESFRTGIHDDILTQLSKIAGLKVISRTSALQYEGTTKPIREIARELGVVTVLEGGVQRAGERVRVNVQLIDAGTDAHLWAETYDEELSTANIFAIQSAIAHAIARSLEARLTPEEEAELAARPTESLEAYDLYSRARYVVRRGTLEAGRTAIGLYRRAIEADPGFAAAHARLAWAYVSQLNRGGMPREEALAGARPALARAEELGPDLPEVQLARGYLLERAEGDYAGAEEAYRRAVELAPGDAEAHGALGGVLASVGRFEEGRAEFQVAVDRDPLWLIGRANLAFLDFLSRDYAAAEAQALRVLELDPEFPYGHYILAAAHTFQDEHDEGIAAAERAVELDPDDVINLVGLSFVHARAGHRDRALELAREVEARGGSLKEIALVFAALGEVDRAFEYLERAYEVSPGELDLIEVDPSADPLRGDPRFGALLEKRGVK